MSSYSSEIDQSSESNETLKIPKGSKTTNHDSSDSSNSNAIAYLCTKSSSRQGILMTASGWPRDPDRFYLKVGMPSLSQSKSSASSDESNSSSSNSKSCPKLSDSNEKQNKKIKRNSELCYLYKHFEYLF